MLNITVMLISLHEITKMAYLSAYLLLDIIMAYVVNVFMYDLSLCVLYNHIYLYALTIDLAFISMYTRPYRSV